MKLRKADEMEKSHNLKAAKNAFLFYTAALVIWGIYDFITTGDSGWQVTILLIGTAVYWWSRVIFHRQTETDEDKMIIPTKALLKIVFYIIILLVVILVANYYS